MDPTHSNSRPNAQPEDLNCSTSDNKEGTTGTTTLQLPENNALNDTWGMMDVIAYRESTVDSIKTILRAFTSVATTQVISHFYPVASFKQHTSSLANPTNQP